MLDKLAAAKVPWIRLDIGWCSLQEHSRTDPKTGELLLSRWYVERIDFLVDEARARGMKVLGTLWCTPPWANRNSGANVAPEDVRDYANIAGWAARHWKGRIAAWEIWNEANIWDFWQTPPDRPHDAAMPPWIVRYYASMLKLAYPKVKAADPHALVVTAGTSYTDSAWIGYLYESLDRSRVEDCSPEPNCFDVLATHPYQAPANLPPEQPEDPGAPEHEPKWRMSHTPAVRKSMVDAGDAHKPIWFTEFGWSSHPNDASTPGYARGVTLEQQADYLTRAVKYARENFSYVTNMFWYAERNRNKPESSPSNIHINNYGLLTYDLAEKPSYAALKSLLSGLPRDGTLLRERSSSQVYVMAGGAKFQIREEFDLGFPEPDIQVVPDGSLARIPDIPRDGTLLRERSSAGVYVMVSRAKLAIPSLKEFHALGYRESDIRVVPTGSLARLADVPRDGTLLRELSSSQVYVLKDGRRYDTGTKEERDCRGYRGEVLVVPNGSLTGIPAGGRLDRATLAVDDATVEEGNSGATNATLTVSLSEAQACDVAIVYRTKDGAATIEDRDYDATDGTVEIPARSTSAKIDVAVNGDAADEGDEAFTAELTGATNAEVGDSQGKVTIQDDDSAAQEPVRSPRPVDPDPERPRNPGRPGACSTLKGGKRAACIRRKCGRLKGAKRRACVKKVMRRR